MFGFKFTHNFHCYNCCYDYRENKIKAVIERYLNCNIKGEQIVLS